MNDNKEVPIIACFFQMADGTYRLNQLYTLKDPRPGTLGSIRIYDVDWCERDQTYLWIMSSGGGSRLPIKIDGPYWSRKRSDVKQEASRLCDPAARKRNKTRRLDMPIDLAGCADIIHYLECNGIEQDTTTVYCSKCKDHLPADDLCEHCWWCDTVGWYITPEEGKVCFSADCWDCRQKRRAEHESYRDNRQPMW